MRSKRKESGCSFEMVMLEMESSRKKSEDDSFINTNNIISPKGSQFPLLTSSEMNYYFG